MSSIPPATLEERVRLLERLVGESVAAEARELAEATELAQGLTKNERAELELLRDLRQRVVGFGGDDYTIMDWSARHRTHEGDPYIGCPFCRESYERKDVTERETVARITAWLREGGDAISRLYAARIDVKFAEPDLFPRTDSTEDQ